MRPPTTRPTPTSASPTLLPHLARGALLAYGVGLALQLVHARMGHASHAAGHEAHETVSPFLHWLRDSSTALGLATLLSVLATLAAHRVLERARLRDDETVVAWTRLSTTVCAYALSMVPAGYAHAVLFGGGEVPSATQAVVHVSVAFLVGGALLAGAHEAGRGSRQLWSALGRPAARLRLRNVVVAGSTAAVTMLAPMALAPTSPAAAATPGCDSTSAVRSYDVAAVNAHIPYNRWGQGNENGMVYVLQDDKAAVRDWYKPLDTTSSNRRLRPRPLVLRANEGECVAVRFTNELDAVQGEELPADPRSSMFVRGVPFDVQTSGGSNVGYNDDTTVGIGETVTYYWKAPSEGTYFYNDTAIPSGSEADGGSLAHGLYGTFVVEPAGSVWRDPVTGNQLYTETGSQSGELYLNAVITPPSGRSFRETVQIAQDELPHTSSFAFNYGSEPQANREAEGCPDCVGEETSLSSWAYGDPAMVKLASGFGPWLPRTEDGTENCGLGTPGFVTDSCFTSNVTHAYVGDPTKFRYGMAGVKETHVFHMHAHQWLAEPDDVGAAGKGPTVPGSGAKPESTTIDSQTFGPMEMFTADLLFGAGSKNGTVGDTIFHCHLYPHFAAGFWALFRVHDVLEDGTGRTPDGINVAAVTPLPDGDVVEAPTADNPGYPRFIPGKAGWRAPQPPLGITRNGVPEQRYVAGQALDPSSAEVRLERAVMDRMSGGASKPGAPFNDPCPTGAREVTYEVSAIQTRLTYNERGDFDSQGRVLVLDRDVDDVLAGRKQPEPIFARVNAGDCITWKLTNRLPNWFGNDAFVKLQQTNMFGQHIHLVKFDVLASDGSSNGWNYQEAAFSGAQDDFNDAIAANPDTCTAEDCKLGLPADYDPSTTSRGLAPGQTITERWYADYELRTVFTHDHHFAAVDQNRGQYGAVVVEPAGMDFRDPVTGTYFQPVNDPAHGTPCGRRCTGGAAAATVDVIGPGADDDFREFGLAVADFVSLTRGGGNPRIASDAVNAPLAPEQFPDEDPGMMGVNYRNAPLELRRTKNGAPVDPAYAFSSYVFGDPKTPVLQAYSGDNVRVRLIQGAQEEQHQVLMHGVRWQREPDDPQSPYVAAQTIGISEAFNFEVPRLGCPTGQDCRGDYLYSTTAVDDISSGAWGLLRVNGGKVPRLLELPDNRQTRTGTVPAKSPTALAPLPRQTAGTPCPAAAPKRRYSVVAMQARITYNEEGDHDPYGLVYALAGNEAEIRAGRNPEPLVLRANEGDCIEVTLINKLTTAFQRHRGEGDARLPGQAANAVRVPGLRVSLHAGLLTYDVRGSDGAVVGFNRDQTVGPKQSILYRWFADDVTPGELGAVNLTDYGDVLGHRHHGLYAGLVVEPKGSTWHDPSTGAPIESGAQADIRVPGGQDFRENVLFYQDGANLRDASGAVIEDPLDHPPVDGEPASLVDAEDSGEKGFSYRSEPFRHRVGDLSGRAMADVYDSSVHGDPATPLFRAYSGDEVRFRILMGADKPRQHSFTLAGHSFQPQPDDPDGRRVGTLSGITVGSAVNAEVGTTNSPGDYLYGDDTGFFHRSGGEWGLMRVYPVPSLLDALLPTPLAPLDDPRAGGHPLLPLELDQVAVTAFRDSDGDRVKDPGEALVSGVRVDAGQSGSLRATATTGTDGVAHLSVRAGTYNLTVTAPSGTRVLSAPATVRTSGNNSARAVTVALKAA